MSVWSLDVTQLFGPMANDIFDPRVQRLCFYNVEYSCICVKLWHLVFSGVPVTPFLHQLGQRLLYRRIASCQNERDSRQPRYKMTAFCIGSQTPKTRQPGWNQDSGALRASSKCLYLVTHWSHIILALSHWFVETNILKLVIIMKQLWWFLDSVILP